MGPPRPQGAPRAPRSPLCAPSYDTWIPASEIEASVEDAPTPEKPRKVTGTPPGWDGGSSPLPCPLAA